MKWIKDWHEWWHVEAPYGRMRPWLHPGLAKDPKYQKANVGCGTLAFDPEKGWTNLDQFGNAEHYVHTFDLCDLPYEFANNTFDYMFFSNVLEHIPDTVHGYPGEFWYSMLEELLRITKPDGIWEIHGPDPRDSVYTLQVGGHTRLVGTHTFEHLTLRYKHGAIRTTTLHDQYGAEWVDVGRYSRFEMGKITDWHLRRYLGRRLGDVAAKIVGGPGQIRMVLKIIKRERDENTLDS